ncbi:hypothetical protein ABW21_db0202685 [Orbilia brochopaga]|nr:hypothetical protein ABW21_db0202685 [Drechslerella brochopaga]
MSTAGIQATDVASRTKSGVHLSRLLRLPLEVRELIYGHLVVLSSQKTEPDLRTQLQSPPPFILLDPSPLHEPVPVDIYYPAVLPEYPLLAILQACRQIRSEFQAFLTLIQKPRSQIAAITGARIRHVMDVEIEGRAVCPSWRELPLPPESPYNIIHELRINYGIIFDAHLPVSRRSDPGSTFNVDNHALFRLLNYYFNHGPQAFYVSRLNERGFTPVHEPPRCMPLVETLTINLSLKPSDRFRSRVADLQTVASDSASADRVRGNIRSAMQWLRAKLETGLKGFFERLLKREYLTQGRVKRIVLQLDSDSLEDWEKIASSVTAKGSQASQDPVIDHRAMKAVVFDFDCSDLGTPDLPQEVFPPEYYSWGSDPSFQRTR